MGDIAERVTRKNKDLESTLPLTISAQDGLIDQNEFFNKTVASRDVSGYYLMKNGEFAYNKSYSNGYPWGAVKRLDRYDMGVLSTLYIIFKPTKVNSTFLAKYYDTDNWYKEVSKHAAEGARNHGLLNIAASDFFETELLIPSNIEEQSKIGDFFTQLDHLITLHQRMLLLFFIAVYISLDNDLITKSVSWFSSSCMICKYVFCVVVILECPNLLATLAIVTPSNSNKDACV